MAKRKEPPADEGSPAWMTTFSDLMNLLLCFFVLLFASSTMDEGKIQKIAASFDNISFNVMNDHSVSLVDGDMMSGGVTQLPDIKSILAEAGKNIEGKTGEESISSKTDAEKLSDEELQHELEQRGEEQSEEMYEEVMQLAESYRIDELIHIDYNSQYVELDLYGSLLFESGSADLKNDSMMFLQKIASILTKYKYCIIEIGGYTDNVPISTSKFANNRELSAERARSVYEYIITQENFIDENIKITGYGETNNKYSNATEEGRAKNRRVSIKIYNQQNSQ